jgi:oligopeptide transport system substrate-binding protein
LIGTSTYEDSKHFPELPAVRTTVQDFYAQLTHPVSGIVPPEHCALILDEPQVHRLAQTLAVFADAATDYLLVYYVGHGLVSGRRHELSLGMYHSLWENRPFGSVKYDDLRSIVLDSPAQTKSVILDCCFSGRALGESLSADAAVEQLQVDGTYVLASSPSDQISLALPGEKHTAFTGRLLDVLRSGIPGGSSLLTMDQVYRELRLRMRSQGLPEPQKRNTGQADAIAMSRNVAYLEDLARQAAIAADSGRPRDSDRPQTKVTPAREQVKKVTARKPEPIAAVPNPIIPKQTATAIAKSNQPRPKPLTSSQPPQDSPLPGVLSTDDAGRSTSRGINPLTIFVTVMALILAGSALRNALDDGGTAADVDLNFSLSMYNTKPQESLIPSNTVDQAGANVVQNIWRGLVNVGPDASAPENAMAESITSTGSTVWTIKLKTGQTFHDGTPVTSESFVKAWNWAAYGPNAQLASYFFAPIDGYDLLNPPDPDDDGPKKAPRPAVKKLSGLTVDSPTQFTITLSTPQSSFPVALGNPAFYPLPESFYADPVAFGKKPIGNGPFRVASGDRDTGFTLHAWRGYQGADKPRIGKVVIKTYTSDAAGYADLIAGNLDFMDQVPASTLLNAQFAKDLPGRTNNKPVGTIRTASLPAYDPKYNNPNIGKALSLAIDRQAIIKSVFSGGRTPADGWVPPAIFGYKAGACGEFCTYDPAKAKKYLAKSAFKGPFSYSYNADGAGNKEGAEAICASIRTALAVECRAKAYANFDTFLRERNAHKMKSLFHTGWQLDYPAIQNFLVPLYFTGAGANEAGYSNKKFDELITRAESETGEAATATYQKAEALLKDSMTVIPLWYQAQQSGWSERVKNIKINPYGIIDLSSVSAA